MSDGLLAIDTGAWTGQAATAFHDSFDPEPKKWMAAADALHAAAAALADYAGMLRWAQEQAAQAIELWERGQQATRQAQAQHEATLEDAARQNQANPAAGVPSAPPPFVDPGQEQRQAARDMLTRARQQLTQSGDTFAQVLQGQTPPEEESTWSTVGHGVLDLAGFIPGYGEAADLANAAWYGLEGNGADATLSAAAAIPFVGWGAGATKVGNWGDEAIDAAKQPASSAVAGRDLGISLAQQSQRNEKGVALAGSGTDKILRDAPRLAAEYGGKPEEWIKKSSSSYRGKEGRTFETHWYEHGPSGTRAEFKHKFPHE